MAYIVPDAVVELFSDISLDSGYENTLYFADTSSKDTYFTNLYVTKGLGRFTDLSYNREQRGYVRIGMTRATAINATYMRFKNTSFENKWFYAFVKNAEYINNGVTEITFELDVMMTWMGTFNLSQCFIERQHTLHDGIGNNIAEEGLPTGDYIVENIIPMEKYNEVGETPTRIVIVYTPVDTSTGQMMSGIYSGCRIKVCLDSSEANTFIQGMIDNNASDNIVGVYMIPTKYATSATTSSPITFHKDIEKPYTDIDGYVPKNKKLFCYPYKFLEIDSGRGSKQEYMYEYFNTLPDQTSTGNCRFDFFVTVGADCEVICTPENYNVVDTTGEEGLFNWQERIGASNYPECSFSIDSYRAYRAQVKASLEYNVDKGMFGGALKGVGAGAMAGAVGGGLLGGAIAGPVGIALGGALGGLTGMAGGILGPVTEALLAENVKKREPTFSRGYQCTNTMFSLHTLKFMAYPKSITKNYAMMLDDYFTMFGYAIKQVGVPNMNARPYFTYVKTVGCTAHGNMPSDHARQIEQIFDKGVRFWKSVDNIGNYNLNNAPV